MLRPYIKEYLKYINKSQRWLARETGISLNTISSICLGKTTAIEFDTLTKICKALNCTPNDIIQPDTAPFKEPKIAAGSNGEIYRPIDINPEYIKISKKQLENLLKSLIDKAFEEINSGTK